MSTLSKLKHNLKSNLFISVATTLIIFSIIWSIYYIAFVLPISNAKKSLSNAKNLSVEMKLINSENMLAYSSLEGINPSHPEIKNIIDQNLKSIENTNKEFEELSKKFNSIKFNGTREIKDYLRNDFSNSFKSITDTFRVDLDKKQIDLENFNKVNDTLSNALTYNPYVDLSGLNLDDDKDREEALKRVDGAISGLTKTLDGIKSLNSNRKVTFESNVNTSLNHLNSFSESLKTQNIDKAKTERDLFLTSYKNTAQSATEIFREALSTENIKVSLVNQTQIATDIDKLIAKIEDFQRNLAVSSQQ